MKMKIHREGKNILLILFYHSGSFEFAGIFMDKNNMAGLSNPRRLHYIFLSGS